MKNYTTTDIEAELARRAKLIKAEPWITANAACNAGGKLLRVVELEYKFGRKANEQSDRILPLASGAAA